MPRGSGSAGGGKSRLRSRAAQDLRTRGSDMTVSTLDPRTALVVVDLQKGTIGSHPMAHPAENVIGRAAELAAAFRQRGLPVVLVRHAGNPAGRTRYGQGGGDWPPELTELMPGLGA